MAFAEGGQVIKTFPAEGSEESLAIAIRQGCLSRRAEDPDGHRGHGGIQSG
jgi:hypothetical protein